MYEPTDCTRGRGRMTPHDRVPLTFCDSHCKPSKRPSPVVAQLRHVSFLRSRTLSIMCFPGGVCAVPHSAPHMASFLPRCSCYCPALSLTSWPHFVSVDEARSSPVHMTMERLHVLLAPSRPSHAPPRSRRHPPIASPHLRVAGSILVTAKESGRVKPGQCLR